MNTQNIQEVQSTVDSGYSPSTVRVAKGQPVRLVFDRKEKPPCSGEVLLQEFGVRRALAPFAQAAVEFTPGLAGSFPFTCGMNLPRVQIELEG